MSDEAFKELMGRMHSAVVSSKTAHEHVKHAAVSELEAPGDILANTIYSMNDEIRRKSFPAEMEKEAEDLASVEDTAEDKADAAAKTADEFTMEPGAETGVAADGTVEKKKKKNFADYAFKKKEAGFGLSVEQDLANPYVAIGFNAELQAHEPVIKQAVARIVQVSAASR